MNPKNLLPCEGLVYYVPNILSELNFEKINKCIKWRDDQITLFGKTHPIPRRHQWYYLVDKSYTYSKIELKPLKMPSLFVKLIDKINLDYDLDLNSILANLYRNGQDSNSWHSDDEVELGKNPSIVSLFFGSERRFNLRHKNTNEKILIILEHGSVLIMKGKTQYLWQHQIPKERSILKPIINLTLRKVY